MRSLEALGNRLRSNRAGFTLIELVVVVVIIGILTAIAIPSYGAIQQNARAKADNVQIKTYITGLKILKSKDMLPPDNNACLASINQYAASSQGNCAIGGQDSSKANNEAMVAMLKAEGVGVADLQSIKDPSFVLYNNVFYNNHYNVIFEMRGADQNCAQFGPVVSGRGSTDSWSTYGDRNSFNTSDGNTFCIVSLV